MPRLLFVCLGNICRSPTAEAIATALARRRGLALTADSAGTGAWHLGEPPDPRMREAAGRAGYDLSALRARQIDPADFRSFDLILAMDRQNLADIEALRARSGGAGDAPAALFLPFGPSGRKDVPDPYLEGGFDSVTRLIEQTAEALLDGIAEDWPGLLHRA